MLLSLPVNDDFARASPLSQDFVAATFTSVFAPARQQGAIATDGV